MHLQGYSAFLGGSGEWEGLVPWNGFNASNIIIIIAVDEEEVSENRFTIAFLCRMLWNVGQTLTSVAIVGS